MIDDNIYTVETGRLFSLPAKAGSSFESNHSALSMLSANDSGKFSAKIVGDKHQLVLDIQQASNLSIDGKEIKIDLLDGAAQARYIISYSITDNDGLEIKAKMDLQDPEGCKRIKFKPVSLTGTDDADVQLVRSEEKIKRDLDHSVSDNGTPDALRYLQYKSQKATTGDSQKSGFKVHIGAQDKRIIENRGTLTTQSYSKNTSLAALPAVGQAKTLDEGFKTDPDSVAHKIDEMKSEIIEGIGSSQSWDDVGDSADTIALLHGKPTYTKDVDTYAGKFIKPEYSDIWKQAGLDPSTLNEDIRVLAKLPVLGEANNPVKIMRGGAFSAEQKQQYLLPIYGKTVALINDKLDRLPKNREYANALQGKEALGTAGFLLRSVAAMDQPRPWRIGKIGCDKEGRFVPDALIAELQKNSKEKGYDLQVTDAIVEIYNKENQPVIGQGSSSLSPRTHLIALEPTV